MARRERDGEDLDESVEVSSLDGESTRQEQQEHDATAEQARREREAA